MTETVEGRAAPSAQSSGPTAVDRTPEGAEAAAWALITTYTAPGKPWRRLLLPPTRLARVLRAARLLPRTVVRLSDTAAGCAVRDQMRRAGGGRTVLGGLTSCLRIPTARGAYEQGASKQTVRRKERSAARAGVTWALVDDPEQRHRLHAVADAFERRGSHGYRTADPDNDDLLGYGLWIEARSSDGGPLLLSVTSIDEDMATLRYFRTLDDSQAASDARYLITRVLVDELADRGVRLLIDTAGVQWLSPGLRHFQRMLGFRLVRLAVRPARRRGHHPECPLA